MLPLRKSLVQEHPIGLLSPACIVSGWVREGRGPSLDVAVAKRESVCTPAFFCVSVNVFFNLEGGGGFEAIAVA